MGYILESQKQIDVKPLSKILGKYLKGKRIDLMSIDTEGYDEKVLLSNNWNKYRPKIICVESVEHSFKSFGKDTGLKRIFVEHGYEKYLDNGVNCIYINKA